MISYANSKRKQEIYNMLEKKIHNLHRSNNTKVKLKTGSNITLTSTNIAYIKFHSLKIKGITSLFFNDYEDVYINNLNKSIPLKELEIFF